MTTGEHYSGVYIYGSNPALNRLRVATSYAMWGAGLYSDQSAFTLNAAIFESNTVLEESAGIRIVGGQGTVISNVVVALSTGDTNGCVVDTEDGATLYNSIAFQNDGTGICAGSTSGYNLSYGNTGESFVIGGITGPGKNDLSADPSFTKPESGDFSLQNGSPGIDAGNPDTAYTDRDGSVGDMGAFGGPESFE